MRRRMAGHIQISTKKKDSKCAVQLSLLPPPQSTPRASCRHPTWRHVRLGVGVGEAGQVRRGDGVRAVGLRPRGGERVGDWHGVLQADSQAEERMSARAVRHVREGSPFRGPAGGRRL